MATSTKQYKTAIAMLLRRLNQAVGCAEEPYTNDGTKIVPNAGNFHLENQNNCYAIYRMSMEPNCTGETQITGFTTLAETYARLGVFVQGVELGKELAK